MPASALMLKLLGLSIALKLGESWGSGSRARYLYDLKQQFIQAGLDTIRARLSLQIHFAGLQAGRLEHLDGRRLGWLRSVRISAALRGRYMVELAVDRTTGALQLPLGHLDLLSHARHRDAVSGAAQIVLSMVQLTESFG